MSSQPQRFGTIKTRLQELAREQLDVSKTGVEQGDALNIIDTKLEKDMPRIFGALAPEATRRRYYATRVVMQMHRSHRTSHLAKIRYRDVQSGRIQKENRHRVGDGVIDLTKKATTSTYRPNSRDQEHDLRRPLSERSASFLGRREQLVQENSRPSHSLSAPAALPAGPINSVRAGVKEGEVINIKESEEIEELRQHRFISDSFTKTSTGSGLKSQDQTSSSGSHNSVTVQTEASSSFHLFPSTLPNGPDSEGSHTRSIDIPSIKHFLEEYASPPMTEFLARFIEIGVRNTERLNHIAGWTPEERLELFKLLPPSITGLPVTNLDFLAFERAFVRYFKENVAQ